jgi:hypothetical protein
MPPLSSQHSVQCLAMDMAPAIWFKLLVLHVCAYTFVFHNRFHQFCGTRKMPKPDRTLCTLTMLYVQLNMGHQTKQQMRRKMTEMYPEN